MKSSPPAKRGHDVEQNADEADHAENPPKEGPRQKKLRQEKRTRKWIE